MYQLFGISMLSVYT